MFRYSLIALVISEVARVVTDGLKLIRKPLMCAQPLIAM